MLTVMFIKGAFVNSKACGCGVCQFTNGNVYAGNWKDDNMDGKVKNNTFAILTHTYLLLNEMQMKMKMSL